GTELHYEPATPPGAPTTLDAGKPYAFRTARPFVVTSSDDGKHPFVVTSLMTGAGANLILIGDNRSVDPNQEKFGNMGDPEFVNVIPTQQYVNSYVFVADPTYARSSVQVVRHRTSSGFAEVTLDCAGELGGWQDLGTDYQYTRVEISQNYAPVPY